MKPLIINHKIYGSHKIIEPVLIELIKSPALKRLKKISQLGAHDLHYKNPGKLSRFQHSIGVMLLLKKFDAPPEEQIAGLLHDVSHTAFSHVADFVYNSHTTQDYQDKKMAKAFLLQGINKILKKHKINPAKILDESRYPLLEKNLPDICADRLDYTFQDPILKRLKGYDSKYFLENLIVYRGQFVFKNYKAAKKFSFLYLKINQLLWCNPLEAALYQILANIIKSGMQSGLITKKDLFSTDKEVLDILKKDKKLAAQIKLLGRIKIKTVEKKQADFHTKSKIRIVDPYFLKNGKPIRLTSVNKIYKRQVNKWSKQAKKGFYIKIIN